jgi:hypothetical protein
MTDQVVPKGADTCWTDLALLKVELGSIAFYLQGNRLGFKLRGLGIVYPSPCHAIVEGRPLRMDVEGSVPSTKMVPGRVSLLQASR